MFYNIFSLFLFCGFVHEKSITMAVLEKVAENARLSLSKEEKKRFLKELGEILEAFSIIDEADVDSLLPSFQPVKVINVFREDVAKKCLSQQEALSGTKHKKQGYFLGPRVL